LFTRLHQFQCLIAYGIQIWRGEGLGDLVICTMSGKQRETFGGKCALKDFKALSCNVYAQLGWKPEHQGSINNAHCSGHHGWCKYETRNNSVGNFLHVYLQLCNWQDPFCIYLQTAV